MFCIYCGKELVDDSAFCIYCGKKVHRENVTSDGRSKQQTKESTNEEHRETKNNSTFGSGVTCPKCGATHNLIMVEKTVGSSEGGYDYCTGGLGLVGWGPAGLLLGLFERKENLWVCNNCGHEFSSPKGVQRIMSFLNVFAYFFLLCNIIMLPVWAWLESIVGLMNLLFVVMAAVFWYNVPNICNKGGYSRPEDVLGNEYKKWAKSRKVLGYAIVVSAVLDIVVILFSMI